MSSTSDVEGSDCPTRHTSPINPSWWSDSDGRRSTRGVQDADESPWWESECEIEKKLLCSVSSDTSWNNCANDSSASSVTPAWWSEPSSRELSTSVTENNVEEKEAGQTGTGSDNAERKLLLPVKNRKRSREQAHASDISLKEPAVSKLKLEPPSPNADPKSVLQDFKRGIFQPLQSFLLFFTVNLLTRISDLTNTRGWERILDDPSLASQDGSWEEVTVREMYAFIAVVLIMQRCQDVCFGEFWRERPEEGGRWPRSLMKRRRFFTILQILRVAECTDDDPKSEVSNNQSYGENSSKAFKYFFDEVQKTFEVFFHQFEAHFLEEISVKEGPGNQGKFDNYLRIMSPSSKPSLDDKSVHEPRMPCLDGFGKSSSDPVACNGTVVVLGCIESDQIPQLGETGSDPISKKGVSDLNGKESEQHNKQSDPAPTASVNLLPTDHHNGILPEKTFISNIISVRWQDSCLNVNAIKDTAIVREKEDGITQTDHWQEVFIPCPELVYKDHAASIKDNSLNFARRVYGSGCVLGKSFFYHYLHFAVYFSTSSNIRQHLGPNGMLSDMDPLEPILDGLVLLGKPDSVSQSAFKFDSDTSETDATLSSATTDQSEDGGNLDPDEGGLKPHKYIQTRSRMSRKCALCWSLHQEVRRVHTRCTRCNRHFCLSRFRNCMGQAHQDEEVMKQLWDEETGEVQDTNDNI